MAKLTKEEIVAALKEMTVLELNDLVKAVEEEFGVTAAVAVAGPAAAPAEEEEVAKGPTEVSVLVTSVGASKVQVIKAVQAITGLGLMDAKKLVDVLPATIKEKISPVEAEEHKKTLVAAGAEVEVK
ncbi:MAG: 50S ribosomal protein L7/L12 [Bacilli bacterium]|nr:50S ribosomal protein L7/L12 [Bacilli bacterium]